jgi:hypothetical protein
MYQIQRVQVFHSEQDAKHYLAVLKAEFLMHLMEENVDDEVCAVHGLQFRRLSAEEGVYNVMRNHLRYYPIELLVKHWSPAMEREVDNHNSDAGGVPKGIVDFYIQSCPCV